MDKTQLNAPPTNRGPNSHQAGLVKGQMKQDDSRAVTKAPLPPKPDVPSIELIKK